MTIMCMSRTLIFSLAALCFASGEAASWEWAGTFKVTAQSSYTWIAQKKEKAGVLTYADATMKLVVLPVTDTSEAGLKAAEAEAEHGFKATCTEVKNGGTITPKEDACYKLVFDDTKDETTFTVSTGSATGIAFFAEHVPTEFEKDKHYFKDSTGKDIEPEAQCGASCNTAPWEWSGAFATPGASYTWIAQKVNCKYADPMMKIVVLPLTDTSAAGLKAQTAEAKHGFEVTTCTKVVDGGTITPKADACYDLHFNDNEHETTFTVSTGGARGVAFFTAHSPFEFEEDKHFFKDSQGDDVEPTASSGGGGGGGGHDGHNHGGGHDGHNHGGGHDGHNHGEGAPPFEWCGVFDTPDNVYMWTAQKTENSCGKKKYIDRTMKLALFPVSTGRRLEGLKNAESVLDGLKKKGENAMEQTCSKVGAGGVITPKEGVCYELNFDLELWQSLYNIDAKGTGAIAFFAQHLPTEFENTAHYLKDSQGEDIEPLAEWDAFGPAKPKEEPEVKKMWGDVIGATVLVNVVTLIGVIMAVPAIAKMITENEMVFSPIINGFASGAILSCAFFLLLFESTHLIQVGYDTEVDTLWRWGTMVMAGYLLPTFCDMLVSMIAGKQPEDKGEEQAAVVATGEVYASRSRLLSAIIIGDGFHNLCDGFFIGAALQGCGSSFGWSVTLATVLHELPQELADHALLTGPICKLKQWQALAFNFISGLSVLLGGIIVVANEVEQDITGLLLAFGGGVYIHVAAVECMPRIYGAKVTPKVRAISLFAWIVGAILIGLVLLDHEHCIPPVPEGEEDPHAGHHHR